MAIYNTSRKRKDNTDIGYKHILDVGAGLFFLFFFFVKASSTKTMIAKQLQEMNTKKY